MKSIIAGAVVIAGSHGTIFNEIVFLVCAGICIGLLIWLVSIIPIIPVIFKQVITFILYAFAVLLLINFIMSLAGYPIVDLGHR
jgi:hypothetical protein